MIKSFLAGIALCSVLPAFAAAHPTTGASFERSGMFGDGAGFNDADLAGVAVPSNPDDLPASVAGAIGTLPSPVDPAADALWAPETATFIGAEAPMPQMLTAAGDEASSDASRDGARVAAVPGPATMAMMAAGLLGLVGLGRRRRNDGR